MNRVFSLSEDDNGFFRRDLLPDLLTAGFTLFLAFHTTPFSWKRETEVTSLSQG